jgi:branched-chain amino acid transport system substrate-binding protein
MQVNAEGGINGRKIRFISLDDGYSPPKTVEQTRKLVESDHVLGMIASVSGMGGREVERTAAETRNSVEHGISDQTRLRRR